MGHPASNPGLCAAAAPGSHFAHTLLAGLGSSCDNPLMTTAVDQKRRAVTPFKRGDVLEIEQQCPEVVVLKRTKQAGSARPKLVRRKNRRLVFVGEATTTEEANRLLEDFPRFCPTRICWWRLTGKIISTTIAR